MCFKTQWSTYLSVEHTRISNVTSTTNAILVYCRWQKRFLGISFLSLVVFVSPHQIGGHLIPGHDESSNFIPPRRYMNDLMGLCIVQQTSWDVHAISFCHKKGVQHCLCAMFHPCDGSTSLYFKRHSKGRTVLHYRVSLFDHYFNRRVDLAFDSVAR